MLLFDEMVNLAESKSIENESFLFPFFTALKNACFGRNDIVTTQPKSVASSLKFYLKSFKSQMPKSNNNNNNHNNNNSSDERDGSAFYEMLNMGYKLQVIENSNLILHDKIV